MSENTDNANDYALARLLNERVIRIFYQLDDLRVLPDHASLNRSYVLLANELKQIYARQPELQKIGGTICWRVMDNVEMFHENIGEYKTIAYEYTHSGADYGEEHNANVTTLCIKAGIRQPVLSSKLEKLLAEADSSINAFQYELDKMEAKLSFEKITIPVITIGDTSYRLSSMRNGIAFEIISYCFEKFPDEFVGLPSIKKYLQLEELDEADITNLRDKMRGSHFDDKGPLQPFIEISPRKLKIKKITALTDEEVASIKAASK